MSVNDWERSHQQRQKLLQRFGLYPYILNQKNETIEGMASKTYTSQGNVWQSSTKIGAEDNVSKFNFPLGNNYPSQVGATGTPSMRQESLSQPDIFSTKNTYGLPTRNPNSVQGGSPVDIRTRDGMVTKSLFSADQ